MKKSYLYTPEGEVFPIFPKGETYTIEELQAIAGGYVQMVGCGDYAAICDEDGKMKNLPINEKATARAKEFNYIAPDDCFVGNVLFTPKELL